MHIEERECYNIRFISNIMKNYSNDQNSFFLQNNINIASIMFAGFAEENPDFIENFNVSNCVIGFGVFLKRFDNYRDIEEFYATLSEESYQMFKSSVVYINYNIPEDIKWTIENDLMLISTGLNTIKNTFLDLTDRLKIPEFESELNYQCFIK